MLLILIVIRESWPTWLMWSHWFGLPLTLTMRVATKSTKRWLDGHSCPSKKCHTSPTSPAGLHACSWSRSAPNLSSSRSWKSKRWQMRWVDQGVHLLETAPLLVHKTRISHRRCKVLAASCFSFEYQLSGGCRCLECFGPLSSLLVHCRVLLPILSTLCYEKCILQKMLYICALD